MGSAGMKRKGRRHLNKVQGRYRRGGGVAHFDSTPWGPMNVNDGGHDAPATPTSRRTSVLLWTGLALAAVAVVVIVVLSI
ncbi:MAG: hypothetical protein U0W40_05460 [Acidimicrobiia bacterium]